MYQQLTDFINKSRMAPRPGRNSSLYLNSRLLAAVALFGSLLATTATGQTPPDFLFTLSNLSNPRSWTRP